MNTASSQTLSAIWRALLASFNGMPTSRGQTLTAGDEASDALPRLTFKMGSWDTKNWTPDEYQVVWTIPAEVQVRTEHSAPLLLIDLIEDLNVWCYRIMGLPVNADGVIIPAVKQLPDGGYEDDWDGQIARFDAGEITNIADRFQGPYLSKAVARASVNDTLTADLTFNLEFTVPAVVEPRVYPRFYILGLRPMSVTKEEIPSNP